MPVTIDLTGKAALVTGSSRGLGAVIARQLAAAGAAVALHYAAGAERAHALARQIREGGGRAVAVGGDFLASDLASFITGVEVPVCGGVQLLQ